MLMKMMPGEIVEVPSVVEISAEQMRAGADAASEAYRAMVEGIEVHHVRDEAIPGRDGLIASRVYAPQSPRAVIVYTHGGSWTTGGLETHDLVARRIVRDTQAIVVAVCYRKWPEHPYPAAFHDAVDALAWASRLHPQLPLLVGGDSAGGTLAACVALHARDTAGPRIDGQILIYPAVDDDGEVPSMRSPAPGAMLTREEILHLLRRYTNEGDALGSPYALPDRAESLRGLPPTIMVIPGHDLLRSSEERFAQRLQDDGVPVTVQLDPELIHAWVEIAEAVPSASRAFDRMTSSINEMIDALTPVVATS